MITAVHQQTSRWASYHLQPQILTYLDEAGSRSRPDRQGFHVFRTAPAELRQARRTGSTELAILRSFATSNCPSAREQRLQVGLAGQPRVERLEPAGA
jgi:hypothetical protein